jgi:hypothetical protein
MLSREEQRARMIGAIREAKIALLIGVNTEGNLVTMYMNANPIELRGLASLIKEQAERMADLGVDWYEDEQNPD